MIAPPHAGRVVSILAPRPLAAVVAVGVIHPQAAGTLDPDRYFFKPSLGDHRADLADTRNEERKAGLGSQSV